MATARAALESLLKARKLDVTLTTTRPWAVEPDAVAPTGWPAIDEALGGGLHRGHQSEIVGPRSSGRTSLLCQIFAEATRRGEVVALIDPCDRFDPATADAAGVDLSRLLWVRLSAIANREDTPRALKALNLVLQAGGFGIVAFDHADLPPLAMRSFPFTTWMRIARVIEGSQTVVLLLGAERIARSPGGVTIVMGDARPQRPSWWGSSDRARYLAGLTIDPRVATSTARRDGVRIP